MLETFIYLPDKEEEEEEDDTILAQMIIAQVSELFTPEFRQLETQKILGSPEFQDYCRPIYLQLENEAKEQGLKQLDELEVNRRKRRHDERKDSFKDGLRSNSDIIGKAIARATSRLSVPAKPAVPVYSFPVKYKKSKK